MAKKGRYVYEWPRPMVAADAIIFALFKSKDMPKVKVLLIERGSKPYKGKWAIPGGFVELDEELEDAVAREIEEETGLVGVPFEQMRAFGKCGRDPRGRVITITFMGILLKRPPKLKAGDDAAKAQWFDIERIPDDLAFDHNDVIKRGIRRLKKKKVYQHHFKEVKK